MKKGFEIGNKKSNVFKLLGGEDDFTTVLQEFSNERESLLCLRWATLHFQQWREKEILTKMLSCYQSLTQDRCSNKARDKTTTTTTTKTKTKTKTVTDDPSQSNEPSITNTRERISL